MFTKLKQFKEMRSQAKTLQDALGQETTTVTAAHGEITLTMDGNMKVKTLTIAPDLLKPENKKKIEDGLINAYDDASKKIQRVMATKVKEMGGLDQFKM
ncbi:MAG TPA: hypothetical protein DDW36_03670 [Candidatus Magasanikbacteria bacterium]|nr:hypothetical protein [Candidatus Magasanikbacteria bacterium]